MREVYRGNGFIVTTNDCGEIFVTAERSDDVQLRIGNSRLGMNVNYMNSDVYMEPRGVRSIVFRRRHR